jgi:flavin-dependent thymidylate synthase
MKVTLVNIFESPFDNAVAAARTCYSGKGIVTPEQVGGHALEAEDARAQARDRKHRLAESIYKAGHHTTLQHVHVQFALEGVSRQFIWSFLHSHPFYNSEQVSQRYVTVTPDQVYVPDDLSPEQREVYVQAVERQLHDYKALTEAVTPAAMDEYTRLFPGRKGTKRASRDVQKKAQEIGRYALPVAVTAYLYHTVSLITLLRYQRMMESGDTPAEQKAVVGEMVRQVVAGDPDLGALVEAPIAAFDFPESAYSGPPDGRAGERSATNTLEFLKSFDARLGNRTSRLIDYSARGEEVLAQSAKEVLGLSASRLTDDDAIAAVMDPAKNPILGETMNLKGHAKLCRPMVHAHYTFAKKLSHTADSQDQRHRMTPGSRPVLATHVTDAPDYVTPVLVRQDEGAARLYEASMARTWDAVRRLKKLGATDEQAHYLLPNALAVRFTESADLMALHHKMAMRLCYNAQEEIWQASVDEALQVREVHPRIGRFLLPPCGLRDLAGTRPVCPEGDRYCGVKVWRLDPSDYARVI